MNRIKLIHPSLSHTQLENIASLIPGHDNLISGDDADRDNLTQVMIMHAGCFPSYCPEHAAQQPKDCQFRKKKAEINFQIRDRGVLSEWYMHK